LWYLLIQSKVIASWKCEENKEEIRYILKFYYKKGKNATQAAKKICDVYGHDAVLVRVAQSWFKRFQSENFDVKDAPRSGRSITVKVDEIHRKKLSKTGTLAVIISGIKHRSQNNFKPFGEGWIKKIRCLGATWFHSKKFNGSNFHLRIIAKTEQNRTILKRLITSNKKSHAIIMYEKNRSWNKWNSANGDKARIDAKKSDAVRACARARACECDCVCVWVCGEEIGKESRRIIAAARSNDWF